MHFRYRNVAIIDLNKPQEILKRMTRTQKCNVSAAEWNPSSHLCNFFILAVSNYENSKFVNATFVKSKIVKVKKDFNFT